MTTGGSNWGNDVELHAGEWQCAGCGEWNSTFVDSSAGTKQSYVEDCRVCCRPSVLTIEYDTDLGDYHVRAELE